MRRSAARIGWIAYLTVALWLLVVPAAHAYVDPGSTGLMFTWIVAGIAAVAMTFRTFWHRVRSLFTRGQTPEPPPAPDEEPVREPVGAAEPE